MQGTDFFERIQGLPVLVVGDVMVDRYLHGRVERISPEAPVPIVHWQSEENRLGGAANVALNLKALGAEPVLCAVCGEDEYGTALRRELAAQGLSDEGMLALPTRQTTVKTRVMAQHQQLLRIDREHTHDLPLEEEMLFLRRVFDLMQTRKFAVLIFQDYNKGLLTPRVIGSLLEESDSLGIPTAVDPKFRNFWSYKGVTLFKPNLKEVRDGLGWSFPLSKQNLQEASTKMRKRLGHQISLITLSEHGVFADDGAEALLAPTQARQIADVCGAGDTVISVVSLALALGLPLSVMANLANLAGGQVCERVGVSTVDLHQLRREFDSLQNA
jgi:rfaE bifunctional protein kinase chain/domain